MSKFKPLILSVILISFYISFLIFVRRSFPTSEELLSAVSSFYGSFGYEIIFLASMLEALILINLFVPGAVAVGLGAVFARSGELDLTVGIILAVTGALLGYLIDFALGFFGFSEIVKSLGWERGLEKVRVQLQSSSVRSFSLGFIHPNIGALVAVAAGTLRMNFVKFLSLSALSTLIWYSLWAILGFALGGIFLTILTRYAFIIMLLVLSIWILTILYGRWGKR
ncbi:VTT domain-containing protein [Candidatus Daviesbacteria bacterium]|nr:VTT domain-containing protein [Candidatus Daviesbacteria bacterium]